MALSDDLSLFPENTTGAISATDLQTALQSIYNALNDDEAYSTTVDTALALKMAKASNLSDVADAATAFGNIKQAATTSATGVVELATTTEAKAGTDTSRAITAEGSRAAHGYTLFDHYADVGNVGTGEDDLYSDTLPAGLLAANGDKIRAFYAGYWVDHASNTRNLRAYFGGTQFWTTSAYVSNPGYNAAFSVNVEVIRVSSTTIRCSVNGAVPPLTALSALPITAATYTEQTGFTLSNTQVLKLTGEATSDNDIVAGMAYAKFIPAA